MNQEIIRILDVILELLKNEGSLRKADRSDVEAKIITILERLDALEGEANLVKEWLRAREEAEKAKPASFEEKRIENLRERVNQLEANQKAKPVAPSRARITDLEAAKMVREQGKPPLLVAETSRGGVLDELREIRDRDPTAPIGVVAGQLVLAIGETFEHYRLIENLRERVKQLEANQKALLVAKTPPDRPKPPAPREPPHKKERS